MSRTLSIARGQMTNITLRAMWAVLPKRAKVALYLRHRNKIANRSSIYIN